MRPGSHEQRHYYHIPLHEEFLELCNLECHKTCLWSHHVLSLPKTSYILYIVHRNLQENTSPKATQTLTQETHSTNC